MMINKYLDQLKWWLRGSTPATDSAAATRHRVNTELSATVFSGEAPEWVSYLNHARRDRYDDRFLVRVMWSDEKRQLDFRPANDDSSDVASCLNACFAIARERVQEKPFVATAFDELVFGNTSNGQSQIHIRLSDTLPSDASREVLLNGARDLSDTCIVLRSEHVVTALQGFGKTLRRGSNDEILGRGWPLFFRVLAHLGYPNNPRDRFMEKIDLTLRLAQITNNLLYQGVSHGRLVPNQAGELYHLALSQRDGIALQDLIDKNPWLRLLNDLRFLLDERRQHDLLDLARTLVREYLDTSYLRLSLAGIMPDVAAAMAAMPYRENGSSFLTPQPAIGAYGILDDSDLKAWRKVDRPFRDMGYTILRQLGIGEFGRVYEALNAANPTFPLRVALKVDRIRPGEKKQMIQQADVVMQIGRDLAPAPHVIRIYDAGKLRKKKYTFHVLQVVDGDTLDNLLGIAGKEHSSVHRPIDPWQSATDVQVQYLQAVSGSAGESWRRRRMVHSFLEAPTLPQMLDLLTSVLLWIEEIHKLDYAINDLKNGNLMLSRRGQLKGIDLDSYSPVHTPIDRITDFYFLAVSLSLFLLNITGNVRGSQIVEDQLVRDADKLRESLQQAWPFGEIAERCEGRVRTDDVLDFLLQVVTRCRDRTYAEHTWQLSHDIDELIHLKRTIFAEELVLD